METVLSELFFLSSKKSERRNNEELIKSIQRADSIAFLKEDVKKFLLLEQVQIERFRSQIDNTGNHIDTSRARKSWQNACEEIL